MKILKPISLNDTSTFTRASTASYFDSGELLRVANNNVLRLDYDPSLAEGEGTFLVESAAKNLLTYPRDFNNATWVKTNTTVTANSTVAPDGATSMDMLDGTVGSAVAAQSASIPAGTTTPYTVSIFLKQGTAAQTSFDMVFFTGGTANTAKVTITWATTSIATSGTASGISARMMSLGNGIYRFEVTGANSGGNNSALQFALYPSHIGTGTVYAWGAQLEQGAFATSAIPDSTTFTSRASSGTFIGSNGLIQTAGTNVARMQYNPLNLSADPFLLLEAAATNSIRNNTMVGSVAGTPGTIPTNWSFSLVSGLSREIVAIGSESGIDYIDIRYFGTASSAGQINMSFESTFAIPVTTGQMWAQAAYVKLIGGTLSNTDFRMTIDQMNAAGNFVTGGPETQISPTVNSLISQRYSSTATITNGTVTSIRPVLYTSVSSGSFIEVTLRIGLPQAEQVTATLPAPTSVIKTSGSAVTRAADISTSPQATRAADILGTMNSIMTNNVPETENTAWSASTVYKLGDIVRYVASNIHKLYQSLTGSQATVTMTIAAPCVVTWTGHGHAADTPIVFSTTGALPTGITAGTVYYILAPTANTFNIAATPGGAAINTTGTQSGVHTATASNNFNKNPTTNPTIWQDIGSTNTWKMFDQSVQSQTSQLSNIRTDILLNSSLANTVTLLNIATKTARVTMKHPVDGLVYDQEKTIRSYFGVTDWYQYFYHSFQKDTDLLFESIPPYPNATLTIDLNDSGNTVKCGVAVIGNAIDTSADKKGVEHGARIGIQDYSVKSQDDFGNYTIVERNFARRTDFTVYTEPEEMNGLVNLLASLRATPTVYIASGENKHTCMITYGFYKDFTVEVAYPTYSICTIQLEGLT